LLARDLVALKPEVIVGTICGGCDRVAARDTRYPIVFVGGSIRLARFGRNWHPEVEI